MVACFCLSKDARVLIQGQKTSGKTSLLYRLSLGKFVSDIPVVSFGVETILWNKISLLVLDLGGRDLTCPLYHHHYENSSGFIYMIDSSDTEILDNTLQDLINLLLMNVDIKDKPVLVLANKQDLPNAISAQCIEDALKQKSPIHSKFFVRPCSVKTGEGIHEAFRDFLKQVKDKS